MAKTQIVNAYFQQGTLGLWSSPGWDHSRWGLLTVAALGRQLLKERTCCPSIERSRCWSECWLPCVSCHVESNKMIVELQGKLADYKNWKYTVYVWHSCSVSTTYSGNMHKDIHFNSVWTKRLETIWMAHHRELITYVLTQRQNSMYYYRIICKILCLVRTIRSGTVCIVC